ncbi:MAG: hypothetical protein HW400_210 [Candidatus Levybacteria bacterium]|nr:hypothetical protein [Candidatus Levybacteria bacterium]
MVKNALNDGKDTSNELLNSLTHGVINIKESISLIKAFLEEKPSAEYSLVIGTDSHEKEKNGDSRTINLVTAVLVHRRGFGGKYFWRRKNLANIHSLREKIYAETLESLNFALFFVPLLRRELNGNSPLYNLEIHIDVGEHGDTRDMIKEVVGMVTGNGFVAKTKPHAYGASYVADKHT